MAQISLQVNGKNLSLNADDDIPLLYALRDELNIKDLNLAVAWVNVVPVP
jgi:aerobic-type carbon monoxide dehydrogenase small subunit (CoxS/CutS family)